MDYHDIEMHGYLTLDEPKGKFILGHYGKGEILAIFDRRILPSESREKPLSFGAKQEQKNLTALYTSMIKLCDEQGIPYVFYKGEFVRKKESEFFQNLDLVKYKIKRRLEESV